MPTKTFAATERLHAPERPNSRPSARASSATTAGSTRQWYSTADSAPTTRIKRQRLEEQDEARARRRFREGQRRAAQVAEDQRGAGTGGACQRLHRVARQREPGAQRRQVEQRGSQQHLAEQPRRQHPRPHAGPAAAAGPGQRAQERQPEEGLELEGVQPPALSRRAAGRPAPPLARAAPAGPAGRTAPPPRSARRGGRSCRS